MAADVARRASGTMVMQERIVGWENKRTWVVKNVEMYRGGARKDGGLSASARSL